MKMNRMHGRACVIRVDDDARRLGSTRARRWLEIGETEQLGTHSVSWPFLEDRHLAQVGGRFERHKLGFQCRSLAMKEAMICQRSSV
jgi:hypothetical protein